jgi:hypothetical protein
MVHMHLQLFGVMMLPSEDSTPNKPPQRELESWIYCFWEIMEWLLVCYDWRRCEQITQGWQESNDLGPWALVLRQAHSLNSVSSVSNLSKLTSFWSLFCVSDIKNTKLKPSTFYFCLLLQSWKTLHCSVCNGVLEVNIIGHGLVVEHICYYACHTAP